MRSTQSLRGTKTIVFLAAPNTQIMDVAGPYQVFTRACDLFIQDHPESDLPYRVILASTTAGKLVTTNCGLSLAGGASYTSLHDEIDTLLVSGGTGLDEAAKEAELLEWLRRAAGRARRFGSICTGAFLLAAAGLLQGKKATTHWKWAGELASRCKDSSIDPDPIFIRDGKLYTTAGITAGMDLALALVEEDLGSDLALRVAREMVLYLRRPGGQSQFSTALSMQTSDRRPITDLQPWVLDNLRKDLSVEALSKRAGMSPRNFARVFVRDTGITPAQFVEQVRLETARRRLEESTESLEEIASDCGFKSTESLRRTFAKNLHVTPSDYRARFSATNRTIKDRP